MRQKDVKYVGAMVHVMYLTLPMFSILSQCFAAITMYGVWRESFPAWITLPVFFLGLMLTGLVTMILFYKYIYPSYYKFANSQQFNGESLAMQEIRRIVREELEAKILTVQDSRRCCR